MAAAKLDICALHKLPGKNTITYTNKISIKQKQYIYIYTHTHTYIYIILYYIIYTVYTISVWSLTVC